MQNATVQMTCVLAFVVTSLVAGCGTTKRIPVVPTVTATTPANGATGVPITQVITASFNEAMNATTINASTFTVAGPGGTLVGGMSYVIDPNLKVTGTGTGKPGTCNAIGAELLKCVDVSKEKILKVHVRKINVDIDFADDDCGC